MVIAQAKPAAAPAKAKGKAPVAPAWAPAAPFKTPGAQLLGMALPRSPKEEESEILFEGGRGSIEKSGTRRRNLHQIVRIRSPQGVDDWESVAATYDPWYESRPAIKARVLTADGREHWLDPKSITDEPTNSGEEYSNRRTVRAPVPALAPGAVLEVLYEHSEHRPFFQAGGRGREWLYASTYAQVLQLTFDVDASVPFQYQVRGGAVTPKVTAVAGRKQLTFELRDELPYSEWPDTAPPEVAPVRLVEYGYARSWQEVAAAYAGEVDRQLAGFDAATIAKAAVGAADNPRAKAEKLLAFMHANVRYVALELGERSIVPAPPAQVMQQRFGDCKDKATLLVGLLRAVGVPASVVLLETGPGLDVSPGLPGFGTFDHAIVRAGGKDGFWIDPSSTYTEVGVLPAQDQQRHALIADKATTRLVQTPIGAAEANTYSEVLAVAFPMLGRATLRETTSATGTHAVALRAQFDESTEQLKQNLTSYGSDAYGADIERVETRLSGSKAELVIHTGPSKRFELGDNGAQVAMGPATLFRHLPDALTKPRQSEQDARRDDRLDPRTRKPPPLPLWLEPQTRSWTHELEVPPGFVWQETPDDLDVRSGPLRMQRKTTLSGLKLRVEYSLAARATTLPAANVEATHQAVLGFLDTADTTVRAVYAPAQAREKGDYAAAVKLHREFVAADKGGSQALRRFGVELLNMGLVLPARRIAQQAAAADGKSPWVNYLLGVLAYRDDLGRALYPGADVTVARKAFGRAVELEPDDSRLREQYGRSLLASPQRIPLGKGADLTRGRDVFMALRKKENTEQHDALILTTWMYERKFPEAVAFAQSLKNTSEQMRALWVAAIALTSGIEAADKKAAQLSGNQSESVLWAAMGHLMALGEYAVAARIVALPQLAKSQTAERLAETQALADQAGCKAKMHPAVKVILAAESKVMLGEQTPERAVEQLEKAAGGGFVSSYMLRWHLRDLVKANGTEGLMVMFELANRGCVARWQVDEAHDVVRVRRYAPGNQRPATTYLMRKRGGSYRWIAVEWWNDQLARLMREDLAARKFDAAEQWAAWLHDDLKDQGGKRDEFDSADTVNDTWLSPHRKTDRELALWLIAGAYLARIDTSTALIDKLRAAREKFADDPQLVRAAEVAIAEWTCWNRPKESLALYEKLHAGNPRDFGLWHGYITALQRSREYGKAIAQLRELAGLYPDRDVSRLLGMEVSEGQWAQSKDRVRDRLKRGKSNSGELNATAWAALFGQADLGEAVALAEEGVRLSERKRFGVMHTLAVLYAESGRLDRALSTVAEAVPLGRAYPVEPSVWYVYGRVAEALGFADDARIYYERCREPERPYADPIPDDEAFSHSTWQLAKKRLAVLAARP